MSYGYPTRHMSDSHPKKSKAERALKFSARFFIYMKSEALQA